MNGFVVNVDFDIQHVLIPRGIINRAVLDEPTFRPELEEHHRQLSI